MLSLTLLSVTAILCRIGKFTQDLVPQYPELLSFGRLGFQQEPYLLEEDFQWHNINPSQSLEFHPCYDGFECARLSVPLDWNATQPSRDATIAIAIVKKRAKVATIDPRYGGMVILHPGGPGNSGVSLMLRKGKHFQSIIHRGQSPTTPNEGAEEVKFFDVASFDPRGINNTTPVFSCFDDEIMSQTWDIQGQTVGLLGSSNTSFEQIWSRSTAFAQRCATHPSAFANPMGQHIGQYINTSPVIRDMVEIVEKHGEWRELDVAKQLSSSSWSRGSELYRAAVRRGAWKKGQEKLLYWGLSYGTFVGQAFASMQPHRIGRMLLDGVMDADDYTQNLGATELLDTEKALKALFVQCVEAGEASCPWASNNTCENMALQLDSLLSALMVTPLPASGPRGPTIITHSDLATMIFNNIYAPMEGFPIIASIISDLLQGNGTFFAAYKEQSIPIKYPPLPDVQPWSQRSTADAILCADGDSLYNESRITFQSRLTALRAQSPLLADVLAPIRLSCLHWPIRPSWRYEGPFGGKTAHPVLFASQTLDPVTPLRNAQLAAAKFEGAGLIECAGEGHCTIATPSMCTARVIGDYFQMGKLPDPGSICEVDKKPFDASNGRIEAMNNTANQQLWDAIMILTHL